MCNPGPRPCALSGSPNVHAAFGPAKGDTVGALWGVLRNHGFSLLFDALPDSVRTFMITYHQLHR